MKYFKQLYQVATIAVLLISADTATAQPQAALNALPNNATVMDYLSHNNEGWFVYSIPAIKNTRSMCCYNSGQKTVCDLAKNQHGYGSTSDSQLTEKIHIFVKLNQGQVKRIMPVGDHCEVKSDGSPVDWLTTVDEQQSIAWLKKLATTSSDKYHDDSLYVLSLHQPAAAAEALHELAENNGGHYSEQAIFWLGQRQQDGFKYLESLYQKLPQGELRRSLNFALSENNSLHSKELLRNIALNDPDQEQQADAIFWLSQAQDVEGLPEFLKNVLDATDKHEVKEKAIFSLSQINNSTANIELMKLAQDHKDAEVREQALFWLAQNNPEKAKNVAIDLLKSSNQLDEQENAVFMLSQLPKESSNKALFEIIKGDYSRNIKKKALFWLSQSGDADTLKQLEDLL